MHDLLEPPRAGHNNPPPFDPEALAARAAQVSAWADAAGAWLDKGRLETDAEAEGVKTLIDGARKISKEVERSFKDAKAPLDSAIAEVRKAYNPLTRTLDATIEKLRPLMSDFLARKKAAAEAERKRIEAEAAERAAEAERLRREAEARNDIAGQVAAEEAQKAAAKEAKAAARPAAVTVGAEVGSGRGMALVTTKHLRITNIRAAFSVVQDDEAVVAAVHAALMRRVRAKGWDGVTPPGCEVFTTEEAR